MSQIPLDERKIIPTNITDVPNYYGASGSTRRLAWPTSEIYQDILADARSAGIPHPWFLLFSGYRSIAEQQRLWDAHPTKDRNVIAFPGNSSHHTGHTMDLYVGNKTGYSIDSSKSENTSHQRSLAEFRYLRDVIAPKYGLWNLPKEPWHWECDRVCRENFLVRKYGIDRDLARRIVLQQENIPNGDLRSYLKSRGVSSTLSSWSLGDTLLATTAVGFGILVYLNFKS